MDIIERVIYDSCPLCKSEAITEERSAYCTNHPLYSSTLPEKIFWLRCKDCSHSFTSGYFDSAGMDVVSMKTNESQKYSPELVEQWRPISAKMVGTVSNLRGSYSGRWMDVGFGNGALLLTAQEFGYQCTGVDLRKSSIDSLKPYVDDVRYEDFFNIKEFGEFDVISMADVLEHLPYPVDMLKHARALLNNNGLIFISLPNFESPLWQILDNNNSNPYWAELEHFHNFSRERLNDLLSEYGFNPCYYGISERYRVCMEVIAKIK